MNKHWYSEFEDQKITSFSLQDGNLIIGTTYWDDATDTSKAATLIFTNVRDILLDHVSATDMEIVTGEDEILHLEIENHSARLLITRYIADKKTQTILYSFDFRTIQVRQ